MKISFEILMQIRKEDFRFCLHWFLRDLPEFCYQLKKEGNRNAVKQKQAVRDYAENLRGSIVSTNTVFLWLFGTADLFDALKNYAKYVTPDHRENSDHVTYPASTIV